MYHLSPLCIFYIRAEQASEYKIKLGFASEQCEGKKQMVFFFSLLYLGLVGKCTLS
jgi:hypothetical protein